MEGIHPIIEEGSLGSSAQAKDAAVITMKSPVSSILTESTESTESTSTARATVLPHSSSARVQTPSYPFPSMSIASGTPLATPGAHLPFTALSPTVPPARNPNATKGETARHLRAKGRKNSSATQASTTPTDSTPTEERAHPSLYEIAIKIQTEPGLSGWWKHLVEILRDTFNAERASLAVPSDRTEIENVPWAQLAEFNSFEDPSHVNEEPQSARSSLGHSVGLESDILQGKESNQNAKAVSSNLGVFASRPKLESRHSYAGYPPKSQASASEAGQSVSNLKRPRVFRAGSQASMIGGKVLETTADLNAELLKRHDSIVSSAGPFSEDTSLSTWTPPGRVLDIMRPLEADTDPLITSAGVMKVLNNSSATVLTRVYLNSGKDTKTMPKKGAGAIGKKVSPRTQQRSLNAASQADAHQTEKPAKGTTGGHHPSNAKQDTFSHPRNDNDVLYEDYEQIPGTPWAQSPAPSPAPIPESDENPFFAEVSSVREAFKKHPPSHEYSSGQRYEAIGVDSSATILQVPLIHPSADLSRPQQLHRFREDRHTKQRRSDMSKASSGQPSSLEYKKRVPIAILSILAPIVPYPSKTLKTLNRLSSLLATSFYAAWQHTNLQTEVSGLSSELNRSVGRAPARNERSSARIGIPNLTKLNHAVSARRDAFSPVSTNSAASGSSYIAPAMESPLSATYSGREGVGSGGNEPPSDSDQELTTKPLAIPEHSDDYFATDASETPLDSSPSLRPGLTLSKQDSQGPRTKVQKKSQILHSQGATFHNTHPSLPTATGVSQSQDESNDVDADDHQTFKEPSLSLLRSMIDIGATQQFIAEPGTGKLLWVNSKFQAYRSNPNVQHLDDQLWNNIYYKDRKSFRREWSKALEIGEQLSQQVRLERFDGQYRWFHIKFLPLKDRLGLIKYWSGQAMDIHDLHEAEVKAAKSKEKSASEAKYRAIANSLPVVVFAASVPTGMTFANTQWLSYSGQTLKEALGFGFLNHVHPDDLVKCRFPGIHNDIGGEPKHNAAFNWRRQPSERSESGASSAGESDVTSGTQKTIKARDDHSGPPSPLTGLQIPNDLLRELAKDGIIFCAKDGQGNLSITTEMRLKSKDNEYKWHLVQGSYIESVDFGQGEAQWFIACTDISAQKKNEAKIQEANSALEDVNNALESEMQQKMGYLSSMSHEIRTPLNGIIGNLQFLINSGLEESAGEWAHGAQEAAKGMHDLINDILDLSKAEAKMLKLSAHWFDPRSLMEQVMDMLNSKASEKRIELCHETAPNVPKSIRGDSGRIRQVLLNLAGNSIKFTNVGEVIIKCDVLNGVPRGVDVRGLRENEIFIRWKIIDTGIGFSEEDKKLLFKAYSQISSKSTRDIGGTGLGLLLCKTMVNLHGGEIDATSQPGVGSVFTFFARFRVRKGSLGQDHSSHPTPATSGPIQLAERSISPSRSGQSPFSRPASIFAQDSPALLSDSSSAPSFRSVGYQQSIRSSISTIDSPGSETPMKLTLPHSSQSMPLIEKAQKGNPASPTSALRSPTRASTMLSLKAGPLSPKAAPISASGFAATLSVPQRTSSKLSTAQSATPPPTTETGIPLDAANSRPPMLSVLVICPPEGTRRITCERIQQTVPKSTPCNITPEESVEDGLGLLLGEEPILFTHIVLRFISDDVVIDCLQKILASRRHAQACIVIITDQSQITALKQSLPELDFELLNQSDRIKMLLKPAHPYKLAKIFDPFNENSTTAEDTKEAKRREEKRLQKEAYALFKRVLGGKGIKVIAVEDDKLQMNILNNFLAKICELDVTRAWNGKECLNLYLSHDPEYYSIIITDTEMPVLNGLSMCRQIRAEEAHRGWPPIPVVSLSANTMTEGWKQASEAGFSHYCGKPVNFRELGQIILELTDPAIPHKYLRERPMPKALLKMLWQVKEDDDEDDEEEQEF